MGIIFDGIKFGWTSLTIKRFVPQCDVPCNYENLSIPHSSWITPLQVVGMCLIIFGIFGMMCISTYTNNMNKICEGVWWHNEIK